MSNSRARSRVILILPEGLLPAWQYACVQQILGLPQWETIAILTSPVPAGKRERWLQWGLEQLCRVDKHLFRVGGQWARGLKPLEDLLDAHATRLPCLPLNALSIQTLLPQAPVDLIINLTSLSGLSTGCFPLCHGGIWSFFHAGGRDMAWGGVEAFAQGSNEVVSGIQVECATGDPQLLFVGSSSLEDSLCQSSDQLLWKLSAMLPELLAKLDSPAGLHTGYAAAHARFSPMRSGHVQVFRPNGRLLLKLAYRCVRNVGMRLISRVFYRRNWVLLTLEGGQLDWCLEDLSSAEQVLPPAGYFWADPFLLKRAGREYVFFEEFEFACKRGHLACMDLTSTGPTAVTTILRQTHHLSYPFLFEFAGELYLLPESAENHSIDLYRCERFPDQWVFVKSLMSGLEAYDATLYPHAGRWWMFVNLRQHPDSSPHELLYLFSAETPLSDEWEPHPENPVVTHASSARPAGALFTADGCIYRPSQNCAGSYGRGLNINRVIEWNRHKYRETLDRQYIPAGTADLEGLHTLTSQSGRIVIDGIHVRKRWLGNNGYK